MFHIKSKTRSFAIRFLALLCKTFFVIDKTDSFTEIANCFDVCFEIRLFNDDDIKRYIFACNHINTLLH